MSIVEVSRDIPLPTADVWTALADISGVHRFHPSVSRSALLGEQPQGIGARRTCEFYDGNRIEEEVVRWEEGRSMEVEITAGSMPLTRARARLELEPRLNGSRVVMRMDYTPKWGPLGKLMDVMMMRERFRATLAGVLEGLQTHLETGAVVGEDGRPQKTAA